jgi:putative membrane protein
MIFARIVCEPRHPGSVSWPTLVVQNEPVPLLAQAAALVAAFIHVWFFVLESVRFSRPEVWRRFGLASQEQAAVVRPMALNQGFYNLFLAGGIAFGLVLIASGNAVAGRAIVLFACGCMVGAGLVLAASNRRFLPAAAVQAVPPFLALVVGLIA